jgi:hypothetical protein
VCLCCYLAAYNWYTPCWLSKDVHHSGDRLVLGYGTHKIPTNVSVLLKLLAACELRAENFYIFFVTVGSERIENCLGVGGGGGGSAMTPAWFGLHVILRCYVSSIRTQMCCARWFGKDSWYETLCISVQQCWRWNVCKNIHKKYLRLFLISWMFK